MHFRKKIPEINAAENCTIGAKNCLGGLILVVLFRKNTIKLVWRQGNHQFETHLTLIYPYGTLNSPKKKMA